MGFFNDRSITGILEGGRAGDVASDADGAGEGAGAGDGDGVADMDEE